MRQSKSGIPYYEITKGYGYWKPNARMKLHGFHCVPCGKDGPEARAKAQAMNAEWEKVKDDNISTGYVYFVSTPDGAKIGYSIKPWEKVKAFKDAIVYGWLPGNKRDELIIYRQFTAHAMGDGWYSRNEKSKRTDQEQPNSLISLATPA